MAGTHFRALSANAAFFFAGDRTAAGRIEWMYHGLSADPEVFASELEKLQRSLGGVDRALHDRLEEPIINAILAAAADQRRAKSA